LVVGTDYISGSDFNYRYEDLEILKRAGFHGEKNPVFELKHMLEKYWKFTSCEHGYQPKNHSSILDGAPIP
jgi:hypothetical protein